MLKKLTLTIAIFGAFGLAIYGLLTIDRAVQAAGQKVLVSSNLLPDLDSSPTQTTKIYDKSGELLYEIGSVYRRVISINEVPDSVRNAFLAAEDRTFYTNPGFSIRSLARALSADLQHDEIRQGGSTITQQLAQMLVVSKDNTLQRKIKEIAASIMLTRQYSKDSIMERYLNEVPVGGELVGIGTAAELYFGSPVRELSLAKGAYLAAMINAPGVLDPYLNPAGLQSRQQLIIDRMAEFGFINEQTRDAAKAEQVIFTPRQTVLKYPFYSLYVRRVLEEQYGRDVLDQGLTVYTSLDADLQGQAEQIVADKVAQNAKTWQADNASLISVDPSSGQILAYVGGADFNVSQVDINTSLRQPGSTMKPLIYYTAFEQGYNTETYVLDAVEDFGGGWKPTNYGGWASGRYVALRTALASSLNIPAVRVLRGVGIPAAVANLKLMGFPIKPNYNYTLPLALGSEVTRPVDMAQAYAVLANGGRQVKVSPLLKVIDRHGQILLDRTTTSAGRQILDAKAVAMTTSIISDYNLKRSIYAGDYFKNYTLADRPAAAKTGTSSGPKDAWTIGYTPQLLTVVWTGNTSGKDLKANADGINVAAPIWHNFMTYAHRYLPEVAFDDVKRVQPDAKHKYIDTKPRGYIIPSPTTVESSASAND